MNFKRVVLELPNTVAGHRFFVAEHSGIDSVLAAQECEKAPKEGVFVGDDWLALAVPCAQLSVVGARVGLSRIVVRWDKGQMPSVNEVPAVEAQLQEILRSVGEYARNLSAEFLKSRLVVELPAAMLHLADQLPNVKSDQQASQKRIRRTVVLMTLVALVAFAIVFMRGMQLQQDTNSNATIGASSPDSLPIVRPETEQTLADQTPRPSQVQVPVSVDNDVNQTTGKSALRESRDFSRQVKKKFDEQYSNQPDRSPETLCDLAVLPDAFSPLNLSKRFNSIKAELGSDDETVADFAEFSANVLSVCSFNIQSLEKLERNQGYIDQVALEAQELLKLIDQVKACQNEMQLSISVFSNRLKEHGLNLNDIAEQAEKVNSYIRKAEETPTLAFALSKTASRTSLLKLEIIGVYITDAAGNEVEAHAIPRVLRLGKPDKIKLSNSNRKLWGYPSLKLRLLNMRAICKDSQRELPGEIMLRPSSNRDFATPQSREILISADKLTITIIPNEVDLVVELVDWLEPNLRQK